MTTSVADASAIDRCIARIKKMRRTKVVGLERGTDAQKRAWVKVRYDTLKDVERELRAMKR